MSLAISEIDREPRILDLELAARLEFARPRKIRELIAANRLEIEQYGALPFVKLPAKGKGRPGTECWLNEGQALLLCMFSQTNRAAAVRKELIDTFMEWRQKSVTVRKHNRRPPTPRTIAGPPAAFSIREAVGGMAYVEGCVPQRIGYAMMLMSLEAAVAKNPVLLEGVFS